MADTNIQVFAKDYIAVSVSTQDTAAQVKNTPADSFGSHLDRTSKGNVKQDKTQTTSKKTDLNDEVKKNQNVSKRQKELEEESAAKAGEANVSKADTAGEALNQLKEDVAKELDMSVEELEGLMETMGFDDMALFDAEKLGMIVLEANGLDTAQELLFDSEAADEFKNVMELLDTAASKLSQAEIEVSGAEFADSVTGEVISLDNSEIKNQQTDNTLVQDSNMTGQVKQEAQVNVLAENDTVQTEKPQDTSEENSVNSQSENMADTQQTSLETQENESAGQDSSDKGSSRKESNSSADGNLTNNGNVSFNPIDEIQAQLTEKVGGSQAENIINQLMERIKVTVNDEFQSMEMQLYPEHLGKVGVHVAIRDGILTAHITAENETVKNAIEAQLLNLKESFNNQGLKVENVEVTIASHSYEENNMSNRDEQSEQGKSRKGKRVSSSLIDELNGISEDISEDTVMEALGNTVSYTA